MKTIHLIIGTRPEAIKMAPVLKALQVKPGIRTRLISTGQHRELLHQTLNAFDLKPDFDLDVMMAGQSLSQLTAKILTRLEDHFKFEKPDMILAHGDTTTCYATALSCFYHSVPLFHVEAGLRTFKLNSPYPEEFNRQCIARLANHHFAPSEDAKNNLLNEGIKPHAISVIGNTVHDAIRLMTGKKLVLNEGLFKKLDEYKKTALFTLHRRESPRALEKMMTAIKQAAIAHPETVFIFPVHPNPQIRVLAQNIFAYDKNIILTDPLEYPQFLHILNRASVVLTDSGGVQEEAAYFGKQTLILRNSTERGDGLSQNLTEVIGTDPEEIIKRISSALAKSASVVMSHLNSMNSASQIVADVTEERCLA